MTICTMSRAQSPAPPTAVTESQISFNTLKRMAGEWEGSLTTDPAMPGGMMDDKPMHISLHVTSRGNAVVHEMQTAGTVLDSTKYDHPVTMFYLEDDHLTLIHYCDAGNRPRMVARKSAHPQSVEFDFAELSGGDQNGHMHHAVLTAIDADHHTEDWT